jgi:hypothetical protein
VIRRKANPELESQTTEHGARRSLRGVDRAAPASFLFRGVPTPAKEEQKVKPRSA